MLGIVIPATIILYWPLYWPLLPDVSRNINLRVAKTGIIFGVTIHRSILSYVWVSGTPGAGGLSVTARWGGGRGGLCSFYWPPGQ